MTKFGRIAVATAAFLCLSVSGLLAQTFPSKPLTIVVAFAAGGPADIISRAMAPVLSASLGQPVIVVNRPGANGKLAMQAVLRADRDGHTIAYISSSLMAIGPLADAEMAGFVKEIVPLTTALRTSNAIAVHPSLGVKTVAELVAWAKANPGKLFYGSIGEGSWYHLATEKLLNGLGIQATHVPYRGEAPALQDFLAGNIQLMIVSGAGKPHFDSDKLVAIAVTGRTPAMYVPKAPPLRESGIAGVAEYDEVPWVGYGTAVGVPAAVVAKLHEALVTALKSDDVRKRLAAFGETETSTIEGLRKAIDEETASNRALIQSGRVKLQPSQ